LFTGFLIVHYTLFIALIIKKSILSPTAKQKVLVLSAHFWSWLSSSLFTAFLIYNCKFGVSDQVLCGIQHKSGLTFDGIEFVPILTLLPIQVYILTQIVVNSSEIIGE